MIKKENKKTLQLYEAPFVIVLFLLIIFLINGQTILVKIALLTGFLSLLSRHVANVLTFIWRKLLAVLGFVNAHILLTAVFFTILFPLAILSRMTKKDPLKLKAPGESNFTERNHKYVAKDLQNPW